MEFNSYPLLFKPILKERIWGGEKLKSLFGKSANSNQIGESWELSSLHDDVSEIANGVYEGRNLNDLIVEYPKNVLGVKIHEKFGSEFPLLFKYLDAKKDLSIQLHPNDELAKKRHNSFGKTEMWYVVQADEGSKIIVGFKEDSTPDEYLVHLENKTLTKILNEIQVRQGDVFFLETGTIHAIGAGVVIAEVQQTSDITYRLYDWDRVDDFGNARTLHTEEALEAITYSKVAAKRLYNKVVNEVNPVVRCDYFNTNFIPLNGKMEFDKSGDFFTVLMCTDGEFCLKSGLQEFFFKSGDTILVPASLVQFSIEGNAKILEISIS